MDATRRDLLRVGAAAAGATAGMMLGGPLGVARAAEQPGLPGATTLPALPLQAPPTERKGDMLYRKLGKTGETVSLIGLGGYHISKQKDERESIKIIRTAIDRGITFMDNCWDYADGKAEERMGDALKDGYRQKVFLMTKIDGRTAPSAARQIDESLKRLKTDHVDLMQHHEIIRMEDPYRIFAEGGAMEAVVAAQKAGKVRYIGFTGHKDPLVHLRMLEIADQHAFHFDAAQMPLNVMDAHFRSFARLVVPVLVQQQVGVLGMKSMGSGDILKSGTVQPIECLHYAMSLPTSVVITGMESLKDLDQAMEAVRTFQPMNQDQVAALLEKTKAAAASGRFEEFKTGAKYDGTAHNPKWLG
jgi:predicted aldo/keto reductase-like oxidoreductase